MDAYRTLKAWGREEHTEKKSRFIGTASPATTQEEALDFLTSVKKEFPDARHHCYAYLLRDGQIRRYSDDGEPQGTAGIPMLEVLQREGVTDCAVVVTRYFGGTLLGTGGLVRAYTKGAKIALEAAGILQMQRCALCSLRCDYAQYGLVQSALQEEGACGIEAEFLDCVTAAFYLPVEDLPKLQADLTERSYGKLQIFVKSEKFMPIARNLQ